MMEHRSPHIVALILAGGTGQRFGADVPKQFVSVGGKSILHHTLEAFYQHVGQMVVVCEPEWYAHVEAFAHDSELARKKPDEATGSEILCTAPAGATGFESLCSGINALQHLPDDVFVMIHDAVRPLVTTDIITANLEVAFRCGNAIASVETYETLFTVPEGDGVVRSMTRRDGVFRAQTPQTFTLGALRKMISEARRLCIRDAQSACVLAHQLGYELHLSPGDLRNFKITTPSDLYIYEALLMHETSRT